MNEIATPFGLAMTWVFVRNDVLIIIARRPEADEAISWEIFSDEKRSWR
jgi:hypothetical protein